MLRKLKNKTWLSVVAHTSNSSTSEEEASGFEASRIYTVNSKPAELHSETFSKTKKDKTCSQVNTHKRYTSMHTYANYRIKSLVLETYLDTFQKLQVLLINKIIFF